MATPSLGARCILAGMFHRFARHLLEALAVLVFVLVAIAGLAAWRLSQGPVSVAFLGPVLDSAIEKALPGHAVEFADTIVAWGGVDHGFDIRVRDLRIIGPQGRRLASVAEATIGLAAWPLLRGRVEPARIVVTGPMLKLERGLDGVVRLGGQGEEMLGLDQVLTPGGDESAGASSLRHVAISGAEIEFTDMPSRAVWRARDANVVVTRRAGATSLDADMRLIRRDREAHAILRASQESGTGRIDATLQFEDLALDLFTDVIPGAAPLAPLALQVSGQIGVELDSEARVRAASFTLAGRDGRFVEPRLFPQPVLIKSTQARGRYALAQKRLQLDSFALELEQGRVEVRGDLVHSERGIVITGRALTRAVPVDALQRLWPLTAARNARRWITANLSAGRVDEGQFDVALAGPTLEQIDATKLAGVLKVQNVNVNYLTPMPPVIGVSGTVTLDLKRVDIATTGGSIGNLRVDEGKMAITGLDVRDQDADIDLVVRGPVREQIALIDSPPLGFAKAVNLNPADFAGDATVRVRFVFPLEDKLKVEQIGVTGSAEVKGFGLKRAALGQDARDGEVALKFNEKGLNATGKLMLSKTAADIDYTLNFLASDPVRERIKASGRLPPGDLATFGFDFAPYLGGPLPLSLDFTARRTGANSMVLEADLEQATLAVPELGWSKPAGPPGSGRLELVLQRERPVEIRNLRIAAADADITGRVRFTADGKAVARAELDRVRLGKTNLRAVAQREGRGWRAQLNGAALDLTEVKIEVGGEPSKTPQPRLVVDATLQRVHVTAQRFLQDVVFAGERGAAWERGQLVATGVDRTGKTDRFTINLSTNAAGIQAVRGRSANAGAMLRSLGVTDQMVGGELELEGATDEKVEGRPLGLNVLIRNYRIVEEPAIARFLAMALLTGLADSMRGEGIGFERLDGRALLRDSVVEITDMRTSGPALGIQARGKIDIGGDRIDMEGTIVPANAVNSLFGRIPVVGEILFGPGLFAARYSVRGPRGNPDVTINPLSALAPGILRNIFGIFDGGGSNGGAPAPGPQTPQSTTPSGSPSQ
ncbi:MAG: AsmA-like C-terminal domain-containing protein [Alphaproteobacteria bacterium]|nr:AsmA-like C-terminal domain-containing protein [Alphaproteobacteria bacterium]